MRGFWKLPLLLVASCGLKSLVDSRALPGNALDPEDGSCRAVQCLVDPASVFRRVPVAPPRIGLPKGGKKGGGKPDTGDEPSPQPGTPEEAPPRLGTGERGDSGTQGEGNGPPRIGADKPEGSAQGQGNGPARIAGDKPESSYSGPKLIGESKPFGQLQEKGRKVDNELHTAIKENKPDTLATKLTDKYEERPGDKNMVLSDAKDLEEPFKEIGVDLSKAKQSSNTIVSEKGPSGKGAVVEGRFYHQDGTIVGERRFAGQDYNPSDVKMKSSDIVFSQWQRFASHRSQITGRLDFGTTDDVNKLKNFVGRNIQSRSTVETMETAHKNTKQPLDKPGVFKRDSQGEEKGSFDALLGTDSLSSINYMLKDHHQALGNKIVKEVHTYPRTFNTETREGRQKVAVAVKFEEYRP